MPQLSSQYRPRRTQDRPRRHNPLPLLAAATAVCLGLTLIPSLGRAPEEPIAAASPPATVTPIPTIAPAPEPTPGPTPTPKPTPAAFDFTQPTPAAGVVEMDYFADALFIGDSHTDDLRLCSDIKGTDFYCYKGLTVFEMGDRAVVELDDGKYTVEQALKKGPQYAKVYISLSINELGYFNDEAFHQAFGDFPKQVKASQPDAVVCLENLVPVNTEKYAASKQPYYVNNDWMAAYNTIFPQLAEGYQVVPLDMADALTDENGILPADATVDGVHFTKAWYQRWLTYLMERTVDADCYAAGQTVAEGANEIWNPC